MTTVAAAVPPMRAAIAAAEARLDGLTAADVPVGAVVFETALLRDWSDEAVLSRAVNEREAVGDPTAHAEIVALRRAASRLGRWRLDGFSLAVSLEPCVMCAGALVAARVDCVLFGAYDPKAGAAGSVWDVLRDRRLLHRPEVLGGVLEAECAALLREFFSARRLR